MPREQMFMKLAAEEALNAVKSNAGGPFGAVIVIKNQILATGYNMVISTNDPTAHAEITTIRKAIEVLKKRNLPINFSKAEIFSSCEPCPMCLAAICQAGISKVHFGATRGDAKDVDFDDSFIYDVFSGKAIKKQIDLVQIDNIKDFLKSEYNLEVKIENEDDKSFIIQVNRDDTGKVIFANIIARGKDNFKKTNDPTSFASVNAIRQATHSLKSFDLSNYEMVALEKPSPLSFSTMHWAKLTKVFCGVNTEPENGINKERILHTINADSENSLLKINNVGREDCMKAFDAWKHKDDKVNY
jgi:guanine deaminase